MGFFKPHTYILWAGPEAREHHLNVGMKNEKRKLSKPPPTPQFNIEVLLRLDHHASKTTYGSLSGLTLVLILHVKLNDTRTL